MQKIQSDPVRTIEVCPKVYTQLNGDDFITYYWEGAESAIFMDADRKVITPPDKE